MVLRDYKPVPGTQIPRPGSNAGVAARDAFKAGLEVILGDDRFLWIPNGTDTTTSTDDSRYAATITWDATIAARYSPLGSGWAVDFNGTSHEGDTPDADRYSFGSGAVDSPFSVVALVRPDVNNAEITIVSKYDVTTAANKTEWKLQIDGNGHPRWSLYDLSASADLERRHGTAVTVATWQMLTGTYDGTASEVGMNIYKNGTLVDNASSSTGTYVAMENTAALVRLGFHQGAAAGAAFFDGKIALVAVCAKALSIDEVWAIKGLVNGYFDLTL